MREIDTEFELFKSLVTGLDRSLFPTKIKNEASDVEVADKLLNNPDIGKFLTAEFVDAMKEKLNRKAQGLIKQAEIESQGLNKFATAEFEPEEENS